MLKIEIDQHIGHTIHVGRTKNLTYVMTGSKIVNDNLMIQVEGEEFPTIYCDSVVYCSCQHYEAEDFY